MGGKPKIFNNIISNSKYGISFEAGSNAIIKNNVSDAVKYAKVIAKKQDIIVITGSLFTISEAREILV